jgi:site-specific recombinase XerD
MNIDLKEKVDIKQDWLAGFKQYMEHVGKSEMTIKAYLMDIQGFARWFEGVNGEKFTPEFITGTDLKAYRQYCLDKARMKPATWNRKRISLHVLWRWSLKSKLIQCDYDVFEGVQEVEQVKQAPRWLGEKEYLNFIRQVEKNVTAAHSERALIQAVRDRALVALMVWAGLREGEVVALEVDDIVISERKGEVIIRHGKGGKRRTVPLNKDARSALDAWIKIGSKGSTLFIGKQGDPLGVRGIQHRVHEIAMDARIGHIAPHQLRHTFCKRMLNANGSILGSEALIVVADLVGHSSLDTTRHYVQTSQDELAAALERL